MYHIPYTAYSSGHTSYIEIKPNAFTAACMEQTAASSSNYQCHYLLSEPIQLLEYDTFNCHLPHISVVFGHML